MSIESGTDKELFSPEQFATAYPEGIERHWWILARNRMVARLLRRFGCASIPVLEVGCGRGAAVVGLRGLGIDCVGVELAPVAPLAAVREHVVTGCDALALPVSQRQAVRVILLLDVLEHMGDPSAFLGALQQSFPQLRHLVVTVPARAELWSNYDEFYGHYRRFDLRGLRAVGEAQGWRVQYCAYAFHALFASGWLMARIGASRSTRLRGPLGWRTAAHAAIAGLFAIEWAVLPGRIPGSSALACFELPGR